MSRLSVLANRPKRVLGALALLLLAVGVAVGSGANFTAQQSSNPTNTFSAGTLSIDNNNEGAAILDASNMKINESPARTGIVRIENTGTLSGVFTLSGAIDGLPLSSGDAAFANQARLTVLDCGTSSTCGGSPTTVYPQGSESGSLAAFPSGRGLGTFAKNEYHYYKFSVTLPSGSDDNALQGHGAVMHFEWDAVQS